MRSVVAVVVTDLVPAEQAAVAAVEPDQVVLVRSPVL
jgi:hypothetical protein